MIIQTLATCHNRKQKTLASLQDLHAQELPEGVTLQHTIVDDGSTDGTAEAVAEQFPDVEIVTGPGDLFWAGGMRYGWEHSFKNKTFDYLFVYNDDVRLKRTAIIHLFESAKLFYEHDTIAAHAIAGSFTDSSGTQTTYSGAIKSTKWHPFRVRRIDPSRNQCRLVDTMNFNGALISRQALQLVGFLSDFFVHSGADFEYGLKLNKAEGRVALAPGYIGTCDRNGLKGTSLEPGISLLESYKRLVGPKEQPPMQRFKYTTRYAPFLWPFLWASPYLQQPFRKFKAK